MSSPIRSRKHVVVSARKAGRTAATAFATLAVPGALYAQQTLPEVKVQSSGVREGEYKAETSSNPKVTRPLAETPQTITVIPKEVIQNQQATTLSEALRNTPGVTMLMGENGNSASGDSIFMRGFDTQGSIFVDGIRDLGTYSRDTFNIDSVEVVKGPAGADIGRGAPTGYVNLSTKVPVRENFAIGSLGVGTGVWGRATADVNRQLGKDGGTALRLNLMKQGGDAPGRDEVGKDAWGVAPSLALGLGTPTRIYLYALHLERDAVPDGGLPTVGLPGYYAAALANAGVSAARADTSNFYGSTSDHDRLKLDQFTARIEHTLRPGLTLRNATRYGRSEQNQRISGVFNANFPNPADPSSWTVDLIRQGKDQRNEILTNQTSLSADFKTGAIRHTAVGGIELIHEKQTNKAVAGTAPNTARIRQSLYNPSTGIAFDAIVPTGAWTRGETTTVAVYAGDTMDLTDRVQLSAGLRFDRYRTEYLSIPAATAASQAATTLQKSDLLTTWKLGALYKLAPNGNVYAAYGYSEKPPGSDNFTLSASTPNATTGVVNSNAPNVDPQEATNLEVGTKWELLDKRLAVTAALFRTENKNEIAQQDLATGDLIQYGKRRVQGLELGAVGSITPAWQMMAGAAWMDTEVVQGPPPSATSNQTGAQINWSPKFTLTAWTTYRLPFGLTLGGGLRHVATQARQVNVLRPATTSMPEVPSYTVFDAMAQYDITRNFSVQLNLYNLTDKFYVASMNNAGNRYVVGTPRAALLTGTVRF